MLKEIAGAETVGPIFLGMNKPYTTLERGATVEDIINMAAITTVEAQSDTPL